MTVQTISMIIMAFILGVGAMNIIYIYKNKKNTPSQSLKNEVSAIVVKSVKRALRVSTAKSYEDLKNLSMNYIMTDLTNYQIDGFDKEDIEILVDLVLKAMANAKK